MLLNFVVNPVTVYGGEGWNPDSKRLGGTEESVVEWAKEFARRGHDVRVYYDGKEGEWHGAKYLDYSKYRTADREINVKHATFHNTDSFYFTNETDAGKHDLSGYEAVIWPSKWAMDNIKTNAKKIRIVPHGYDPKKIYPEQKIPKTVLYASSPDRGLDNLIKVWPEVVKAHPDAMLIVTYGVDKLDIPNVTCLGEVDEDMMNSLIRTSDIWCHPANGGELYGMVGVKAQVAQCVPVYFPTMALQETVRHGVACNSDFLATGLIGILDDEKRKQYIRNRLAREDYPTWEQSANILEAIMLEYKRNG